MGSLESGIEEFLMAVDGTFPVPISKKTDLHEFAGKLFQKATLCCGYEDGRICSMVAGYTENTEGNIAYISLVATRPESQGKGHACRLLKEFIGICREKGLDGVHLYTDARNAGAAQLYWKLGFRRWVVEGEPRESDLHYVYWLNETVGSGSRNGEEV